MKIVFFTTFIFGLIIFVFGQSTNPLQENKMIREQQAQTKCSPIVEGLQLCTPVSTISTELCASIPIRLIIKNLSEKTVTIMRARFDEIYNIRVTDAKGNQVLSKNEIITEKIKNKTASKNELGLPINSLPQKIQLASRQELRLEYNLSDFYDLSVKGKYQIEISRKVPKQNGIGDAELSFGIIQVEIK